MYALAVASAQGQIAAAKRTLMANMDQEEADRIETERMAAEAMAATAAKLYAGISGPTALSTGDDARHAAYNMAGTAIVVTIGTGEGVGTPVPLSEDKEKMVYANHGWEGKRYVAAAGGDSYEAVVFSNVEAMKEGKKFGNVTTGNAFQYELNTDGALPSTLFMPADVAFTGVTRTAGTETFESMNMVSVMIRGSYHGVDGTYSCVPSDRDVGCSATVAAKGFTVSVGDVWTFTPGNANARVMDAADTVYASYGWWLRKAANDGPFTASAFVDEKGTVNPASGLDTLNGTATYMGGAAGKYALSSSTGGTNDAGHFTARATLEADFTNNEEDTAISGTLDKFMGADDQPRDDWKVELNGSQIGDVGEIGNASASAGVDTVWTIGGTAAAASGNWTGSLQNQPPPTGDGVPQVATGTFYSEYGSAGKMVGGFGATKQ